MENINKLICYLIAISNFAKDIHYTVKGEAFYSKHELADRIYNGLNDFVDQLKETCILGNNQEPLSSIAYLENTIPLIPLLAIEDKANFVSLKELLEETLVHTQMMLQDKDNPRGEVSLVDNIAQDLQQKLGLVNLQVK